MDTSPSSDGWRASVAVFSGRPDPEWPVPADLAAALVTTWASLPPAGSPAAGAPPLGYRGARLVAPDGREWAAFGGVVTLAGDARADAGREWERRLVETAPPGTLPPGLVA